MHRAAPLSLAVSLFAACSSAPPPPSLVARGLFDASYEGSASPLDDQDASAFAFDPQPATEQPMASLAFRATLLEMSLEDARSFVPDLVEPPPREVLDGERTEQTTRTRSDTRGDARRPRLRGIGLTGGHVEPAALREALAALTGPGVPQRVVADSEGVVAIGGETAVTASKQLAFVRRLRYAAIADSFLVDDIDVETFEYGLQLRLAAHRDGDELRLDVRWLERAPVRPIAVSGDTTGRLQVPVMKRHDVAASTTITSQDSIVVASLPGSEPGTVQLLCIEVALQEPASIAAR